MMLFISLALAAFIIVTGSFFFGHDADGGDGGDAGHDVDSGGGEPTISIFSTKVLGSLVMGFGASGAVAMYYGASHVTASLIGLLCGLVLAGFIYLILGVFYREQSTSLVATSAAVGCTGAVTVSIGEGAAGEVGLYMEGQYRNFSASSLDGKSIAKGQIVRVVKTLGSHLIVEHE